MAVSYVSTGSESMVRNGTTRPGIPNAQNGDLLVCLHTVVSWVGTSNEPGTPSGWTMAASTRHTGFACRLSWLFTRYQAGMATPSLSHTGGSANDVCFAQVLAFRGADTNTPTDVFGAPGHNSSQKDVGPIPGVATTQDGGVVLVGCVRAQDWQPGGGLAPLSGDGLTWREAIDVPDYALGDNMGAGLDYALTPTATTVTPKTFSVTTGNVGMAVGQMWAIRPEAIPAQEDGSFFPLMM